MKITELIMFRYFKDWIKSFLVLLFAGIVGTFGVPLDTFGAPRCWESQGEVLRQATASAGMWTNARNNPDSVKFQTEKILKEAVALVASPDKKDDIVNFTYVPQKFLSEYKERAACEEELKKTTPNPIKFENLQFNDVAEMTSWFKDFSQGKGTEGEKLYKECPGSCSPQYCLEISEKTSELLINVEVICGHARDKDDNSYKLELKKSGEKSGVKSGVK